MINDRQLTISTAGSRKATHWPAQVIFFSELIERLRTPARGQEAQAVYLNMKKSEQDELKDVGGFVGGSFAGNRRKAANVQGRDILTLDLDNIPAGATPDVLRRLEGLGCAYVVYSTRKHMPSAPRLRIIIPIDRTVSADEYEPLARKLAAIIGIELCDPTTFEASRLMYWPSCSVDAEYVFYFADKPFVSADGLLALYADWRNVSEWPQVPGTQQTHIKLAAKQGDPTAKNGIVGAFCKIYDVYRAMDTFLLGIYLPTDDGTGRYTYTGGSTTGGAVVYDDGAFLYSHHATDPCSGRLVNAFDLVRLHKFGESDDEAKPDTPINKLPSYVAMCEFAVKDTYVAALLNQERYEKATQDFATLPPDRQLSDRQLPDDTISWISKLAVSPSSGAPAKTIRNVLIILENDPLLRGKIAFDEFSNRGLSLGALPWDPRTERRMWTDNDDRGLREYVESAYGITSPGKIDDALGLCAHHHTINDVRDYLTGLAWDGAKRLDALLVDYLGAMDTPYTREVARKSLVAAVARVMTPGCKFDYMPIFTGPQGIGKSTFLGLLGQQWYSDSLETFEGKEAAELIQGVWINEIGELTGMNKSESNAVKRFLSKREDIFREPFGKRTGKYPRRCVFFGTSNETEFLKDHTGDRRFWPVDVGLFRANKDIFKDLQVEVPQIWAEAFFYWQLGESLRLSDTVEVEAKVQQEAHRESDVKEGLIREFLDRKIPVDWEKRTLSERRMYWSGEFGRMNGVSADGVNEETAERRRVCAAEVWCECLGNDIKFIRQTDTRNINGILKRLTGWNECREAFGPYGHQRGFKKNVSPNNAKNVRHFTPFD